MKKFIVLIAMVALLGSLTFAQLGTDVYVGYDLGLKTATAESTDVKFYDANSARITGDASNATSFINLGLLVDYEIADGFSIGGGVGGALPMTNKIKYGSDAASSTAMKFALDGLVGVNYAYPLEPVMLKANLTGGLSFLDMSHMGYLVKAKFGLGYDIGGFTVSLGAGYELRNYTIKPSGEGAAGKLMFQSIPIELGITLKF